MKVIYANRFDRYADLIQRSVSDGAKALASSGGQRTIRFDLGGSCGTAYADIGVVQLPYTVEHYADIGNVLTDARATLPGRFGGYKKFLVFFDAPNGGRSDFSDDRSAHAANSNNASGAVSAVGLPETVDATQANFTAFTALHELFHSRGSVMSSALHHVGGSHCGDSSADLMCKAIVSCDPNCNYVVDAGGDDYFSVAPSAGS